MKAASVAAELLLIIASHSNSRPKGRLSPTPMSAMIPRCHSVSGGRCETGDATEERDEGNEPHAQTEVQHGQRVTGLVHGDDREKLQCQDPSERPREAGERGECHGDVAPPPPWRRVRGAGFQLGL